MTNEKLFSFNEFAGELKVSPDDLARIIKDSDGKLPTPSIINRLTDECFFTEEDHDALKGDMERSTLTPEEFFRKFEKRGRPRLSKSGESMAKKKAAKGTGKPGRPKKQTKD